MWNDKDGIDMTKRGSTGQAGTLHAGEYTGIFVGCTVVDDRQYVTVAAQAGTHVEHNDDLDCTGFNLNDPIRFVIELGPGAGLIMKGTKYRLVDEQRNPLTDWGGLDMIVPYIEDNDVPLAKLTIKSMEHIDGNPRELLQISTNPESEAT